MSWCLTNWCDALDALAQREFFFYSTDEIRSNFFLAMSLSLSFLSASALIPKKNKERTKEKREETLEIKSSNSLTLCVHLSIRLRALLFSYEIGRVLFHRVI